MRFPWSEQSIVGELRRPLQCIEYKDRWPACEPRAEFFIFLVGGSRALRSKTTNISIGGVARTLEEIRLAERSGLKFTLPNAVGLKADGEVVWADTKGMAGLRFPELPELPR